MVSGGFRLVPRDVRSYDAFLMAIFLDDKPVQLEGGDLESVLATASARLGERGRVVVEVQLDGLAIVAGNYAEHQCTSVSDAELRLYSADPHELAVTTLQQVKAHLDQARQAQLQAAELFQQDKQAQALEQVIHVIEVWQQVQQAVLHSVQLLRIDVDEKQVDGQTVVELTDSLIKQLKGLHELLTSVDTVGLADVLAYEWPQTADRWERLIVELIGWIEQQDNEG